MLVREALLMIRERPRSRGPAAARPLNGNRADSSVETHLKPPSESMKRTIAHHTMIYDFICAITETTTALEMSSTQP